jgi:DNA-binding NarL/FixJ family response regulator
MIVGLSRLPPGPAAREDRNVPNKILIVDDDPRFRAAAAELLAARGFEVVAVAADGEQALAAAADDCPDGILLDINLPGADGFTVAASLAAACPRARIVLTSAAMGEVPARVLTECAATAFVPKDELALADLRTLLRPAGR